MSLRTCVVVKQMQSNPIRWLEMLQMTKMGVETIHFTKTLQKIGVETFLIFPEILGSKQKISRDLKQGGQNGGAYVVTFI